MSDALGVDEPVGHPSELTDAQVAAAVMSFSLLADPTRVSRLRDASLKKAEYARLGVPSFWLADPSPERPCVTAFELDGESYREVAAVRGDDAWDARRPFAVQVVPADLIAGLLP